MKKLTLQNKIAARIISRKDNIFLRSDFEDLGGYDQVGQALKKLVLQEKLVKIGYGLYSKTKISFISGQLTPIASLPILAKEALKKLGVKTCQSSLEKEHSLGLSTQVPTGRLIGVVGRVSRKIKYKNAYIGYERVAS